MAAFEPGQLARGDRGVGDSLHADQAARRWLQLKGHGFPGPHRLDRLTGLAVGIERRDFYERPMRREGERPRGRGDRVFTEGCIRTEILD